MTQRVFDIENEKDMQDLWNILPDDVNKIEKYPDGVIEPFAGFCVPSIHIPCRNLIKINWHDKKEITRPIQEATEEDIGKICKFWNDDTYSSYGILSNMKNSEEYKYRNAYSGFWLHCRRLTEQEIEELC